MYRFAKNHSVAERQRRAIGIAVAVEISNATAERADGFVLRDSAKYTWTIRSESFEFIFSDVIT